MTVTYIHNIHKHNCTVQEPDVVLVMTAAQAMRQCIEHACCRWDLYLQAQAQQLQLQLSDALIPPSITPATSVPTLSTPQMDALAGGCLQVLTRYVTLASVTDSAETAN
jgi:hypothetical protein